MTAIAKSAKTHPATKNVVTGKNLPYVNDKGGSTMVKVNPAISFSCSSIASSGRG